MNAEAIRGNEVCRPFLPAKDFELSKRFYETLGFAKLLDGDVAIFEIGRTGFILQNRWEREWAENAMMQLMVDNVDDWFRHLTSLSLAAKFGVRAPKNPEMQPWGLKICYLFDPSGVLWHIAERRPEVRHDS